MDAVPNPVSALPNDNNGVVVSLPSVAANGQETVNGTLYFGIGTQSDNQPGPVDIYRENSNVDSEDYLDINTVYNGITAGGFLIPARRCTFSTTAPSRSAPTPQV